jgi:biotin-(acetyl-CoA carboxylase) ligase
MTARALNFPPLFSEHEIAAPAEPFEVACQFARDGCDSGLVVHARGLDRLRAAIVFAPEVALREAMAILPACGLGFQNAFGALGPPQSALTLTWDGVILLNGGRCGGLRVACDTTDPDVVPNWLVVGLDLVLMSFSDDPGETPDLTALDEEGCGDIDPGELLEAWLRHGLFWINQWSEDGPRHLHRDWEGILAGVGETVTIGEDTGVLLGIDANFGALLKGDTTRLVPLSECVNRRES